MIRTAALAGLLILAACNRNQAALTPDADAELRNATAAKTLADIAAAEDAATGPLPAAPRPRAAPRPIAAPDDPPDNETADLPTNEAAPPQ